MRAYNAAKQCYRSVSVSGGTQCGMLRNIVNLLVLVGTANMLRLSSKLAMWVWSCAVNLAEWLTVLL